MKKNARMEQKCTKLHNNTHKKIVDSDWLIAVQFKCNTSANSVSGPVGWKSHK